MINPYISLALFFLIIGCSSVSQKTPQENYDEFLRDFRQNDSAKAKEYFKKNSVSNNADFLGRGYYSINIKGPSWRQNYNKEFGISDIDLKSSSDKSFLEDIINNCNKVNFIDSCLNYFTDITCSKDHPKNPCLISKQEIPNAYGYQIKIENLDDIFIDEWAPQPIVDRAKSTLANLIEAYNKRELEKVSDQQEKNAKSNKIFDQQKKLCVSGQYKYAIRAIARIEKNYGNNLYGARLVGVTNYLCGTMTEIVSWLPKFFILKTSEKPNQNSCTETVLGSTKIVNLPNQDGFNEDWMIWEIMPESKVEKSLYSKPNWHPCRGM